VTRAKSYEAWDNNTGEPNTALATDPALYARKRKILNQALTNKALKNSTIFMAQHIETWLDLLVAGDDVDKEHGWTKTRNMSKWTSWVVFDILGNLCFGRSFEIKEPGVESDTQDSGAY
jgi:hypothetical protein